jgi:N6-L-threonylcarbamoyladenine synthase
MKILGIETSFDDTSAGVVQDGEKLLSNVVASSMALHVPYGGVVPEIAARNQLIEINPVIAKALSDAKCSWSDIDGIAITYGAGLSGSLLIGVIAARTIAIVKNIPLYRVNHVEGHIYANFLTSSTLTNYKLPKAAPTFPILGVIVSGAHSQLVIFRDHFDYDLLGQTRDDAIGEAFDKVAKMLGLPYPGGPSISKAALIGDPYKYNLPKSKLDGKYDFSFSGIKTAVLRLAQGLVGKDYQLASSKLPELLNNAQKADIAASFQRIAVETIVDKTVLAFHEFNPSSVVIGGGVASSQELRDQLKKRLDIDIDFTDPKLCTDNGAMIATIGCYLAKSNINQADPYNLLIKPNLSM